MNRRSLYRSRHDRRLGGVAAGVAEFFDLDPTLVRVVWALSILFGGFGLLLYIVMWIIVPNEPLGDEAPQPRAADGSPHRHASGSRNGGLGVTFFGIALIVFGALAMADSFFLEWGPRGSFLWPGFVLALGILLVATAVGRRETEPRVVLGESAALSGPATPTEPPAQQAPSATEQAPSATTEQASSVPTEPVQTDQ